MTNFKNGDRVRLTEDNTDMWARPGATGIVDTGFGFISEGMLPIRWENGGGQANGGYMAKRFEKVPAPNEFLVTFIFAQNFSNHRASDGRLMQAESAQDAATQRVNLMSTGPFNDDCVGALLLVHNLSAQRFSTAESSLFRVHRTGSTGWAAVPVERS